MFILISQRLCKTSGRTPQTYFKVSITGSKSLARLTKVGQISRDGTWEAGTPPRLRQFRIIRAAPRPPCSPNEHLMELHSFKPNGGIRILDKIAALILTLATEWSALDVRACVHAQTHARTHPHVMHRHDNTVLLPPPPTLYLPTQTSQSSLIHSPLSPSRNNREITQQQTEMTRSAQTNRLAGSR